MTALLKSATIGGTINLGNYDNVRFEFSAEIASTEDYLELVEFAASSLIGQFRNTNEATRAIVRTYVARLCSIEEAQVPCMQPAAPEPTKIPLGSLPNKQDTGKGWGGEADGRALRLEEPAKAPAPATLDQVSPLPERMPPASKPAVATPGEEPCTKCGVPVSKSQAKLSNLFMSKTLCKVCMEAP